MFPNFQAGFYRFLPNSTYFVPETLYISLLNMSQLLVAKSPLCLKKTWLTRLWIETSTFKYYLLLVQNEICHPCAKMGWYPIQTYMCINLTFITEFSLNQWLYLCTYKIGIVAYKTNNQVPFDSLYAVKHSWYLHSCSFF